MADIPPGTALESIMKECALLENIKSILQARVDLDNQYTKDLSRIRDSFASNFNSNSEKTEISSLISPFIQFFDDEIEQRKITCQELSNCLFGIAPSKSEMTSVSSQTEEERDFTLSPSSTFSSSSTLFSPCEPFSASPFLSSPTSSSSITLYKEAVDSYNEAKDAHEKVRTPNSLRQLRKWRDRLGRIDFLNWTIGPAYFQMPENERRYRIGVMKQREAAKKASEFHTTTLSTQIEQHQASLELAQSCLMAFVNTLSEGLANLVPICSKTSLSVSNFSSSRCISSKFYAYEAEKESLVLQPYPYRNYWNNMEESVPLFPLRDDLTEKLVDLGIHRTTWHMPSDFFESALSLERQLSIPSSGSSQREDDVVDRMSRLSSIERLHLLAYNLLISPPLFPMDNRTVTKHQYRGLTRNKMPTLLMPVLSLNADIGSGRVLKSVLSSSLSCFGKSVFLTHRTNTDKIILSIMRKWDFPNHRPLPQGFVNEWCTNRRQWAVVSKEVIKFRL